MTNLSALVCRGGAALLVSLAVPSFGQVLVDVGGLDLQNILGPPILQGGRQCGSGHPVSLSLSGGTTGNLYEVYEYDLANQKVGAFVGSFPVAPNPEGVTLGAVAFSAPDASYVARQRTVPGQTSSWSVPFSLPWPVPKVLPDVAPWPVWECGTATGIRGQQPGDRVSLLSGWPQPSVRFTIPSAFGPHEYVPAGIPGPFAAGEELSAEYLMCANFIGGPGITVLKYRQPSLPAVDLVPGSLVAGSASFLVNSVVNGATLELNLSGAGGAVHWTENCAWSPCRVQSPTGPLASGDKIDVTQRLCTGTDSPPSTSVVPDCGDAAPPELAESPRVGDQTLLFSSYSPGATLVILATSNPDPRLDHEVIGVAPAAGRVALTRAITLSDKWIIVAQTTALCPPARGSAFQVLD